MVPVATANADPVSPVLSAADAGTKDVPVLRLYFCGARRYRDLSPAAPNDPVSARRRSLLREIFGEMARLVTEKRYVRAADQKLGNKPLYYTKG